MALDDKTLFEMICNRNKDQSIEFVMEQYEKAKRLNYEIEKRLSMSEVVVEDTAVEPNTQEEVSQEEVKDEAPAKKKYTRRNLKFKPENAITEEYIQCCLCGHKGQVLITSHFEKHGITVDEYKKLCGYDMKQPLMSKKRLALMRSTIDKARDMRDAKKISKQQSK